MSFFSRRANEAKGLMSEREYVWRGHTCHERIYYGPRYMFVGDFHNVNCSFDETTNKKILKWIRSHSIKSTYLIEQGTGYNERSSRIVKGMVGNSNCMGTIPTHANKFVQLICYGVNSPRFDIMLVDNRHDPKVCVIDSCLCVHDTIPKMKKFILDWYMKTQVSWTRLREVLLHIFAVHGPSPIEDLSRIEVHVILFTKYKKTLGHDTSNILSDYYRGVDGKANPNYDFLVSNYLMDMNLLYHFFNSYTKKIPVFLFGGDWHTYLLNAIAECVVSENYDAWKSLTTQ